MSSSQKLILDKLSSILSETDNSKSAELLKLVQGAGGMQSIKKFREKIKELDKDEKETLINLFLRLEVDEIVIEKEMTKGKNKQVKIRLKDVEVIMKEQRFINVNVKNID